MSSELKEYYNVKFNFNNTGFKTMLNLDLVSVEGKSEWETLTFECVKSKFPHEYEWLKRLRAHFDKQNSNFRGLIVGKNKAVLLVNWRKELFNGLSLIKTPITLPRPVSLLIKAIKYGNEIHYVLRLTKDTLSLLENLAEKFPKNNTPN
jgi:hypothetical protein